MSPTPEIQNISDAKSRISASNAIQEHLEREQMQSAYSSEKSMPSNRNDLPSNRNDYYERNFNQLTQSQLHYVKETNETYTNTYHSRDNANGGIMSFGPRPSEPNIEDQNEYMPKINTYEAQLKSDYDPSFKSKEASRNPTKQAS